LGAFCIKICRLWLYLGTLEVIMAIFLFETPSLRRRFAPLTTNKPFVSLLSGGIPLLDKWNALNFDVGEVFIISESFLGTSFMPDYLETGDFLIYCGRAPVCATTIFYDCPTKATKKGVGLLSKSTEEWPEREIMAVLLNKRIAVEAVREALFQDPDPNKALEKLLAPQQIQWSEAPRRNYYEYPKDLLEHLKADIDWTIELLKDEYELDLKALDDTNRVIGKHPVIIEKGARISMSMLNTENGPIYLSRGVKVMEGCMLRGPLFLARGTVLKMGTRIYGPVATGENCVLGGEIKNSIFHSGTNKGHEGYIGDSIIGAYCNFGAGSGGSNVKNTGGEVRVYDYETKGFREVGQKFGALVGDFTRIGVGTQLTTGSSIGTCCNLFGLEIPPKLVAPFSWGNGDNLVDYQIEKAIEHIKTWLGFKGVDLFDGEFQILNHIFEQTRRRG